MSQTANHGGGESDARIIIDRLLREAGWEIAESEAKWPVIPQADHIAPPKVELKPSFILTRMAT